MSGAKPWQIGLIVVGLIAGIVGVVFAIGSMGAAETAATVTLVDVYTGELFEADTAGKTVMIPMKHPETGSRSLFPVSKDEESGEWQIASRYFDAFKQRMSDEDTPPVDRSTGTVETQGSPRRL